MNYCANAAISRVLVVMTLLTLFSTRSFAQYPGFKPVSDIAVFKTKFAAESARVNSIQGDFKQQKTLSALTEEITSTGKIWFKRTGKVRMDYVSPFVYKLVINNDKMLIRDGEKENRISTKSNKLFQQINRITIDCMQGTIMESKDFSSRVFENDQSYLLELTPVSQTLKEFFQTIVLTTDKKDSSARSIELNEPGGDKTVLSFYNKTINGPVEDAVFAF